MRCKAALLVVTATVSVGLNGQVSGQPSTGSRPATAITIQVTVVDQDGEPIRGLSPSDFAVDVGGRRRGVTAADLLESAESPAGVPEIDLLEVSSNQGDEAGPEPRLVLLLIDDDSFRPVEGEAVFSGLVSAISRLLPGEAVGVAVLSGRVPAVPFTTDRARLAETLRQLKGGQAARAGSMNLAVSEVLEITRPTSDGRMLNETVNRVCAGLASPERLAQVSVEREACRQDVIKEVRTLATELARAVQQRVGALAGQIQALSTSPGARHVLLVSAGVPLEPSAPVLAEVARAAAAGHVTLHAVQVDRRETASLVDVRASPRPVDDERVMASGLEALAHAAGGAVHRLAGDPAPVFDRVRREMSAVYRLTLEGGAGDGQGPQRLQVRVNRAGAVVRAPREVVTLEDTARLPPRERLAHALGSPLLERGLGVRLATFAFSEDPGRGHLLVSAEVDGGEGDLRGGYVVRNAGGEAIETSELGADALVLEREAPPAYVFRTSVPPGAYTVKLAVIDAHGQLGSVVRTVTVAGPPQSGLALSDLLVLPERATLERVRPSARIPQGTRQASVYFELYAEGLSSPEKAALLLEVSEAPEGPAMFGVQAAILLEPRNRRAATSGRITFSPAALPAGRYFARLLVKGSNARAVRSFTITHAGLLFAAVLPDEARMALPRFTVSGFLSLPLLRAVSARLAEHAEGNRAAQELARSLEDGRWRDAQPASGEPVVDATLRGMQLLSAGQPAEAEAAFRDALDADPEFTLALALAGGAWAAVGRDREATRSWRTALATGVDAPFLHDLVTTALLRQGDVKGAREFVTELEEIGADTTPLARERALAAAIVGDRRLAATELTAWVDAHPDDLDAAFLLLLALYELKTIEKDETVSAQFDARARRYLELNGPRAALVARWLK